MTCGPLDEQEQNFDSPILRRLVETWDDYDHEDLDEDDVLDVLGWDLGMGICVGFVGFCSEIS